MSFIRIIVLSALLAPGFASAAETTAEGDRREEELLILITSDPAGDCYDLAEGRAAGPGDLIGAELICRRIVLPSGPETAENNPEEYVYAPVSLWIKTQRELFQGEVQLCLFIHIPPIYIEQIIGRDSFLSGREGEEKRIILSTSSRASLTTGLDPALDAEIEAFKQSGGYEALFFSADPAARIIALEKSRKFDFFSENLFLFPSPPPLYWRKIPPLKATSSLIVRKVKNGVPGPIDGLYHDKMDSGWTELSANFEVDRSRLLLK